MDNTQIAISAILVAAVTLFIWGRLRYDVVSILALLAIAIAGLVPAHEVFLGFGHPAVITVIAVLIISRSLRSAGVVDMIADRLSPLIDSPQVHLGDLTLTCGFCSAFMNNVGASCAFLTPNGHQCNTLVLGSGGPRFSDYWRAGLPLEVLITAVAVPLIMWIWI